MPDWRTDTTNDNLQFAICNLQSFPPSAFRPLPSALRLGFNILLGVSAAQVERIEEARGQGPFCSVEDFARRTGLSRAVIARLAKAGTFGSLRLDRRTALWEALGQDQKELPLFDKREEGGGRRAEGGKANCKLKIANCKLQNDEPSQPIEQFAICNLPLRPPPSALRFIPLAADVPGRGGAGRLPSRRLVAAGPSVGIPPRGVGPSRRRQRDRCKRGPTASRFAWRGSC